MHSSSIPPMRGSDHQSFTSIRSKDKKEESKEIDRIVEDTSKQNLPLEQSPAKQTESWLWSLWSNPVTEQPFQEVKSEKEKEDSEQMNLKEETLEDNTFDPKILVEQKNQEQLALRDDSSFKLAIPDSKKTSQILEEKSIDSKADDKHVEFQDAAIKTSQVSKGWWQGLGEQVIKGAKIGNHYIVSGGTQALSWSASKAAEIYKNSWHKEKENELIASKQFMLNTLLDPQFVDFYEFVNVLFMRLANQKIDEQGKDNFISSQVLKNRDLILDILEINLAKGFKTLAQQVDQNKGLILHYNQQSSLVNIFSFLTQRATQHIDIKQLEDLNKKYQKTQVDVAILTKELFPTIDTEIASQNKTQKTKKQLIQDYIQVLDSANLYRPRIAQELFPNLFTASILEQKKMRKFLTSLDLLNQRQREFYPIFNQIAEDVLLSFFPNKFADIKLPLVLKAIPLEILYNGFAKSIVVELLQDSYTALENNRIRNEKWEKDIEIRLGTPNLKPVIQAPADLLVSFTKNYIQNDPHVVSLTTSVLGSLMNPQGSKETSDESQKQKLLIHQLSQQQLGSWIVKSVQAMLHTEDPYLLGIGNFIQQALNSLTLALLSKGANLVIPEREQIKEDQFIKELSERMVAKFSSLGKEITSDDFWKKFTYDLPLPSFLKDLLIPVLIEKAKSFQAELQKDFSHLQQKTLLSESTLAVSEIQKIFLDSEIKIRKYENGQEILTLLQGISDQIVDKTIGLVSTLDLGDTLDELLNQYLPGVKINKDLTTWFKKNVSALGDTSGQVSQANVLLKQTVQAALRTALITTVEINFKNDSKNYAAQLSTKIKQAFTKTFTGFDQVKRDKLDQALALQAEITTKEEIIEMLKTPGIKPSGITPLQLSSLEEYLNVQTRHTCALNYRDNLILQRDSLLAKLKNIQGSFWTVEKLSIVHQALALQKIEPVVFSTPKSCRQELERVEEEFKKLQDKKDDSSIAAAKALNVRATLISLLSMSSEEMQEVLDALNIETARQHADKELQVLEKETNAKKLIFDQYDQLEMGNRSEWDQAKIWVQATLEKHQNIDKLSREIESLNNKLDTHLETFQLLSQELSGLIGLDQKANLNLPSIVQDTIWSLIEKAKNTSMTRFLFKQLNPLLLPVLNIERNRDKISQLANKNQFLAQLALTSSKEGFKLTSEFLTRYEPIIQKEVATILNIYIPGVKDLHAVIGHQLQEVLIGKDSALVETREWLERYVEGMILQTWVKIAETHQDANLNVLEVLTQKLKDLTVDVTTVENKSINEVAHQMIDQFLKDIVGIRTSKDLEGISPDIQKIIYEKLKEQAYQHLMPVALLIIERDQNRLKLENVSGSKVLGSISRALAKDIFTLLPIGVKSYESIANQLFVLLSDNDHPPVAQSLQFTQEFVALVQQAKAKNKSVTHRSIVKAYAHSAKLVLNDEQEADLKEKLDQKHVKNDINDVLISLEEVADLIGKNLTTDSDLLKILAIQLQNFIHPTSDVYQNVAAIAGTYIEGMLLKIFHKIAEKNPPQPGKDTLVVLTENLLIKMTQKYAELQNKPFSAEEMSDALIHDLLGFDSPDALEGLAAPLRGLIFNTLKDQLSGILLHVQQSLSTRESGHQQVKDAREKSKKFGIDEGATRSHLEILVNDAVNMGLAVAPAILTKMGGEKMWGVNIISKNVESYLEELARGKLEVAQVLLQYAQGPQFQQILGNQFTKVEDLEQDAESKQQAIELASNVILVPLNKFLEKTVEFSDNQDAEFNQKLMAHVFTLAADHFKTIRIAEKLSSDEGSGQILHRNFVKAAGDKLYSAVPRTPVTYQQSIDNISTRINEFLDSAYQNNLRTSIEKLVKQENEGNTVLNLEDIINAIDASHQVVIGQSLTTEQRDALRAPDENGLTLKDLIRQEMDAPHLQRKQKFYDPATKAVLKLIFPNGKKDLEFVPEEMRGTVWNMFKKNLFPVVLPMITELLLSPNTINQIVLSSLETLRDSLRPLQEWSSEALLSQYKKGQLILNGQDAQKVLGKATGEALLKLAKQGQLNVKIDQSKPEEGPLNALDEATGLLMTEVLKTIKLPTLLKLLPADLKKSVFNPETGDISPAMMKTIGNKLREQLNNTFLKDKLQMALEIVVKRNEKGDYILNPASVPKTPETIQFDLKKVSRECVDVSISYFIRETWKTLQFHFDNLIQLAFGPIGRELKQGLDMILGFIFFKVVGSILSFFFSPIKGFVKEQIYNLIMLDENRDHLLGLFTRVPSDQPLTSGHVVYNEDLVFKLSQAIQKVIKEALSAPILPIDKNAVVLESISR